MEAGRNPVKTIKPIRGLLEKLGAEVEDHRMKLPGPSQMTLNADGLVSLACSLKYLEGRVMGLHEALGKEYCTVNPTKCIYI